MARFPKGGGGWDAVIHAAIMRASKLGYVGLRLLFYVFAAAVRSIGRR